MPHIDKQAVYCHVTHLTVRKNATTQVISRCSYYQQPEREQYSRPCNYLLIVFIHAKNHSSKASKNGSMLA
uniref:Uncharacterized protein n=1 Tax=Anguilla anguilla TaxID=7936 RepID=A0A0E9P605_ANGAN